MLTHRGNIECAAQVLSANPSQHQLALHVAKDDPMTMVMTLHGTLLALHGRLVDVRDLVASVNPRVLSRYAFQMLQ